MREGANDVGEGWVDESELRKALDGNLERVTIYFKAYRRIAARVGLPIRDKDLNFLCGLYLWDNVMKRRGGLERFICWTGFNRTWKHNMRRSYEKCLSLELVELKSVQRGKRVVLSTKGLNVLNTYSNILEEIKLEELAKALQENRPVKAVA